MNRIYQGRVTNVEMPFAVKDEKGRITRIEWEPFNLKFCSSTRLATESVHPRDCKVGTITSEINHDTVAAAHQNDLVLHGALSTENESGCLTKSQSNAVKAWEAALWLQHEMYQDGLNYYTLCLAAMATAVDEQTQLEREAALAALDAEYKRLNDSKTKGAEKKYLTEVEKKRTELRRIDAIARWRKQVRSQWKEAESRNGTKFKGPGHRVRRYLGLEDRDDLFDASCQKIITDSGVSTTALLESLLWFLDGLGGDGGDEGATKLSNLMNEKAKWFCEDDVAGADEVTKLAQITKRKEQARMVEDAAPEQWEAVAQKLDLDVFFMTPPTEWIEPNAVIKRAENCFDALSGIKFDQTDNKTTYPELASLKNEFLAEVQAKASIYRIAKATRTPSEHDPALVFKFMPRAETHAVCKLAFKSAHARKAKASDPLAGNRRGNKKYFPYFTTVACKPSDKKKQNRSPWFGFDHAAFIAAIQAPHRYFQDSLKRFEKRDVIEHELHLMSRRGRVAKEASGDDDEESKGLDGIEGDIRIDAVKRVVRELAHYAEEDEAFLEDGQRIGEYGLFDNTLRGWGKLREDWREAVTKESANGQEQVKNLRAEHITPGRSFESLKQEYPLLAKLDTIRRKVQGRKKEEAGSGALFLKLLEPQNWSIWLDTGTEDWHGDDPLRVWAKFREVERELKRNKQDIRFTPADATYSPRYFNIPKTSESGGGEGSETAKKVERLAVPGLASKHLIDEMAITAGILVADEYGLHKATPVAVKISYAAPRLRRDAIRGQSDDKMESLHKAPWVQPMMKALEVRQNPDKINFANCRVTFMPERDQKQKVKVLLGFPVEINTTNLESLATMGHRKRWDFKSSGKNKQMNFAQFCYSGGDGDKKEICLRWPSDITRSKRKNEVTPWFDKSDSFSCLSIDLGQRVAAAYARLEAKTDSNFGENKKHTAIKSRFIGEAGGKRWHAAVRDVGLIRLPGEDNTVWRKRSTDDAKERKQKDEIGRSLFDFREEPWGDRGRPALPIEITRTRELLKVFEVPESDLLPPGWETDGKSSLSFPEINDKLIVATRRYQSRLARLYRWCWFLGEKDDRRALALKEIRAAINPDNDNDRQRWLWLPGEWKEFAENDTDPRLREVIADYLSPRIDALPLVLEEIANRCVPLRDRSWLWTDPVIKDDGLQSGKLSMDGPAKPNSEYIDPQGKKRQRTLIRGQRGLSLKRLEQIDNLRRCLQSLNHMRRREIGKAPPKRRRDDGGSIPDCCEPLLVKLDDIKEQRINQTAHWILAEALGLKVAPSTNFEIASFLGWKGKEALRGKSAKPEDLLLLAHDCGWCSDLSADEIADRLGDENERCRLLVEAETKLSVIAEDFDLHGTYNSMRKPVDFIVIEDLEFYNAQRGRSARENSRLMKWCRRHLRDKLKQLCEVFGLPVVETNPAYTSRFCSQTGRVGFRAVEVSSGFEHQFPWKTILDELRDHRAEKKLIENEDELDFAEYVANLAEEFATPLFGMPTGGPKRTLLLPLGSGDLFVPFHFDLVEVSASHQGRTIMVKKPSPSLQQADINAAVTLAYRAIASPELWEFHPRCRTKTSKAKEQPGADTSTVKTIRVAEKRKLGNEALDIVGAEIEKERNPNYFYRDYTWENGWGLAHIQMTDGKNIPLVSGKALWSTVNRDAWKRCQVINRARIAVWKTKQAGVSGI